MDLRALTQFLHLSQTLHYGKTSELLHVSPSTLSRSISRLESELGVTLFERDNRAVVLTQAGALFGEFAQQTLFNWQQLKKKLKGNLSELSGQVRLYGSVTATYSCLSSLFTRFRANFPQVEIALETGDAAKAIQKVIDDEVDIAVAPKPDLLPSAILFKSMVETPLQFIAPTEASPVKSLLEQKTIPWEKVPFIISELGLVRKRLDQWFKLQGINPIIYAHVSGYEAVVAMVGLGLGVAVVPELVIKNSPLQDKIKILNVTHSLKPFDVGVCVLSKRLHDPLVKAFWQTAEFIHQQE